MREYIIIMLGLILTVSYSSVNCTSHKINPEVPVTVLNFVVIGGQTCFDIQSPSFVFHPAQRFNVSSRPPDPSCIQIYTGCDGCVGTHDEVKGRMISSEELEERLRQVQMDSVDYSIYLQSCSDGGDKQKFLGHEKQKDKNDESPWVFRIFDVNTKIQDINDHIAQHFVANNGSFKDTGGNTRFLLFTLLAFLGRYSILQMFLV